MSSSLRLVKKNLTFCLVMHSLETAETTDRILDLSYSSHSSNPSIAMKREL